MEWFLETSKFWTEITDRQRYEIAKSIIDGSISGEVEDFEEEEEKEK